MQSEARDIQDTLMLFPTERLERRPYADIAISVWRDIGAELSTIIGERGFRALFERSLHLARVAHPSLIPRPGEESGKDEICVLQIVLSRQTASDALAANNGLRETFYDLLTHLIGRSLTTRLLNGIEDAPSSETAAKDDV